MTIASLLTQDVLRGPPQGTPAAADHSPAESL